MNYEEEKDSTDAEYRNTADGGSEVTGEEAMAKLKPILEKLRLKENMSDEVIIDQIVSAFGIKDNYTLIEADITWQNEEKKAIEVKK
ncbi:YusW family protein [Paenisporosarcina sp. NPDC076898]|uniref:YusW family protein n=1 Tax=unclassified Paenisporosarcina TaxID=2642018 RepID=UPI003D04624B